jgi:hypothetical protein
MVMVLAIVFVITGFAADADNFTTVAENITHTLIPVTSGPPRPANGGLSKVEFALLVLIVIATYILCLTIISRAAAGEAVVPDGAPQRVFSTAGRAVSGFIRQLKRIVIGGEDRQPMSLSFDDDGFDETNQPSSGAGVNFEVTSPPNPSGAVLPQRATRSRRP